MNWKQHTAVKAVEDALQYIKMYVAGVSANTAKKYLRNFEEQVILLQSKVWSNYSASETKEYVSKNIPIDNRIWFKNRQTLEITCPENSKWWLVLTQANILFEIPKQCHS